MFRIRRITILRVEFPIKRAAEHSTFFADDADTDPIGDGLVVNAMDAQKNPVLRAAAWALHNLKFLIFNKFFRVGDEGLRLACRTNQVTQFLLLVPIKAK